LNLWIRREGTKILLVDDDERIRDSLRLFFEDQGCSFMAMNGLELLGRIRKTHPPVAKIFTTAYSSEGLFAQAKEAGAVGFVKKPLTAEKIEDCLARIDHPGWDCGP
jgi:CheY-like chemotaxis protein